VGLRMTYRRRYVCVPAHGSEWATFVRLETYAMHLPDMLGFEIDRMMAGAKKNRLVVVDRSRTSSR
jgi:hypothetical protein